MALQAVVVAERMRTRQPSRRAGRRPSRSNSRSGVHAGYERGGRQAAMRAEAAIRRRLEAARLRLQPSQLAPQAAELLTPHIGSIAALVVDDLPIYRHAMRRILEPVADRVFVADDGLEALEQLRRSRAGGAPIDIVITDMHMPVMDGLELISRMRGAGDQTPVVVLTTDPSEELRMSVEGFRHTAVAIKPVDAGCLMEMISEIRRGGGPAA